MNTGKIANPALKEFWQIDDNLQSSQTSFGFRVVKNPSEKATLAVLAKSIAQYVPRILASTDQNAKNRLEALILHIEYHNNRLLVLFFSKIFQLFCASDKTKESWAAWLTIDSTKLKQTNGNKSKQDNLKIQQSGIDAKPGVQKSPKSTAPIVPAMTESTMQPNPTGHLSKPRPEKPSTHLRVPATTGAQPNLAEPLAMQSGLQKPSTPSIPPTPTAQPVSVVPVSPDMESHLTEHLAPSEGENSGQSPTVTHPSVSKDDQGNEPPKQKTSPQPPFLNPLTTDIEPPKPISESLATHLPETIQQPASTTIAQSMQKGENSGQSPTVTHPSVSKDDQGNKPSKQEISPQSPFPNASKVNIESPKPISEPLATHLPETIQQPASATIAVPIQPGSLVEEPFLADLIRESIRLILTEGLAQFNQELHKANLRLQKEDTKREAQEYIPKCQTKISEIKQRIADLDNPSKPLPNICVEQYVNLIRDLKLQQAKHEAGIAAFASQNRHTEAAKHQEAVESCKKRILELRESKTRVEQISDPEKLQYETVVVALKKDLWDANSDKSKYLAGVTEIEKLPGDRQRPLLKNLNASSLEEAKEEVKRREAICEAIRNRIRLCEKGNIGEYDLIAILLQRRRRYLKQDIYICNIAKKEPNQIIELQGKLDKVEQQVALVERRTQQNRLRAAASNIEGLLADTTGSQLQEKILQHQSRIKQQQEKLQLLPQVPSVVITAEMQQAGAFELLLRSSVVDNGYSEFLTDPVILENNSVVNASQAQGLLFCKDYALKAIIEQYHLHGSLAAEDLVDQMVTMEPFVDAQILPCGHSFSHTVIEDLNRAHQNKCPCCRQNYTSEQVRSNVRLQQVVDAAQSILQRV